MSLYTILFFGKIDFQNVINAINRKTKEIYSCSLIIFFNPFETTYGNLATLIILFHLIFISVDICLLKSFIFIKIFKNVIIYIKAKIVKNTFTWHDGPWCDDDDVGDGRGGIVDGDAGCSGTGNVGVDANGAVCVAVLRGPGDVCCGDAVSVCGMVGSTCGGLHGKAHGGT